MDNVSVRDAREFFNLNVERPRMPLLDEPTGYISAMGKANLGHQMRYSVERLDAELADDVGVLGVVSHLLLELVGAGGGDDAQVVLQIIRVHADAVVADGQQPLFLVQHQPDGKLIPLDAHLVIGQAEVAQLVDGVGGVGNDFTQENFLMRVNGVYHEIQQTLGFRLELFLCHSKCHVLCRLALILSEC